MDSRVTEYLRLTVSTAKFRAFLTGLWYAGSTVQSTQQRVDSSIHQIRVVHRTALHPYALRLPQARSIAADHFQIAAQPRGLAARQQRSLSTPLGLMESWIDASVGQHCDQPTFHFIRVLPLAPRLHLIILRCTSYLTEDPRTPCSSA